MGCSVGLKYAKNALAARWGSSLRSPRLPSRLGRGTVVDIPLPLSYPLSAFGALILVPPVEAWSPRCFRAGYGPG